MIALYDAPLRASTTNAEQKRLLSSRAAIKYIIGRLHLKLLI